MPAPRPGKRSKNVQGSITTNFPRGRAGSGRLQAVALSGGPGRPYRRFGAFALALLRFFARRLISTERSWGVMEAQ